VTVLAPYSRPEAGYASLWPAVELGDDLALAMYRVGVRSADMYTTAAYGFGMTVTAKRRPVRVEATTVEQARAIAIKAAVDGPVDLYRAVARGKVTLYERLERIEVISAARASMVDEFDLVAPNGVLLEKKLNPSLSSDLRVLSERLGGQLRTLDWQFLKPKLEKFLKKLDQNWPKMTATQIDDVFGKARKFLRDLSVEPLMPLWTKKISVTLEGVYRGVKKSIKQNFLPRLATSLDQKDLEAIQNISAQPSLWLRDKQGKISDTLTRRGRKIVQEGLDKGLGRNAIGSQLRKQIPGIATRYGRQYANVVAANATTRARSISQIRSYTTAGIEFFEIQAVLDERTTEICRCLDGQIIPVQPIEAQIEEFMAANSPEEVMERRPFLQSVKGPKGTSIVQTAGKNPIKIATVTRSGVGRADDRGQFKMHRVGSQLAPANIGEPPYHHL
jgi:SPP1 gp7 family putative phage head morphogenesis protein